MVALLSGALLCCACSSATTPQSGWSTQLSPPAKGYVLDPGPPKDVYWVAIASAKIPARTAGGQLWDDVGGWPDPVAVLSIDGVEVMSTAAATDTLTPAWNGPRGNLLIPSDKVLRAELFDQDPVRNLRIGQAQGGAPTAADLSEGKMTLDLGHRAELVLNVGPAHALVGLGFDYEVVADVARVTRVIMHSPAGRAGLQVGDRLMMVGGRELSGLKSREIGDVIDALGAEPTPVIVKHAAGTTETFSFGVGPVYPLFTELGELD